VPGLSGSVNYASADQLRGNNDGLVMGATMGADERLSTTLHNYYH